MDGNSEIARRPVAWTLLALAGPIAGAMMSRTAMGLVDFVMVSQLGTEAQAAILPAGIALFALISLGLGMMSAVNTLVSQCHGRGEMRAGAAYTWQGLWASAILGLLAAALWPLVPALIATTDHAPAVAAMETQYLQIGLISIFPVVAAAGVAHFFNGIHRPMVGLWATLIANAFNLLANYVLIFGHGGFPAMGIAGAAWATTASAGINLLVLWLWFLRPTADRIYATRSAWRWHPARMRRLLKIGLPAGVHFAGDITAFTVFTLYIVGQFGTAELAANNIMLKYFEVAIIPCAGMSIAVSAAVGKAIGEDDPRRARRFAHWGQVICLGYLLLAGTFFLLLGPTATRMLTQDAAVVARADQLLILMVVFVGFDGTQILYSGALRGAGDTLWPAVVAPVAAVVLMLGGGWYVSTSYPGWGVVGAWLAVTAYVMVLAAAFYLRFIRGRWEQIDLSEPEVTAA